MSGAEAVFTQALGMIEPWKVDRVDFKPEAAPIDMHIVYTSNVGTCPACGAINQPVHARRKRT